MSVNTPPNALLMESNKRLLICFCNILLVRKEIHLQRIHPNRTKNVSQDKGSRAPTGAGRYVSLSVEAKKDDILTQGSTTKAPAMGKAMAKGSVNQGLQNCHQNSALPARSASMKVKEIRHDITNVK